jgi:hypothetical protein
MFTSPRATAVTNPVAETVARALLLEVHTIARPVRTLLFASRVVAVAWVVAPGMRVPLPNDTLTEATGTGAAAVTVSMELPLWPSHDAMMVAVPTAIAVTRPEADTVATPLLLELQMIVRPVRTLLLPSRITAVA